ncbi:hypothetical protein ACN42_g9607 [Penicillium freii]|uniref:Uncharacterized protein n=1 Tax=Penicillium freii TaxID=48697 RepID=A0A117NLE1_PENFR|nr:hypothetical protein ACN42_g9607 [Penicillium freii]
MHSLPPEPKINNYNLIVKCEPKRPVKDLRLGILGSEIMITFLFSMVNIVEFPKINHFTDRVNRIPSPIPASIQAFVRSNGLPETIPIQETANRRGPIYRTLVGLAFSHLLRDRRILPIPGPLSSPTWCFVQCTLDMNRSTKEDT